MVLTECEGVLAVLNGAFDAAVATDLQGLIVGMNAAGERLLGWKADQAKGFPINETVFPARSWDVLAKAAGQVAEATAVTKSGDTATVKLSIIRLGLDGFCFFIRKPDRPSIEDTPLMAALCDKGNKAWNDFVGPAGGIHPEDKPGFEARFKAAIEAQRQFRMEYRVQRNDGAWRWVLETATPVDGGYYRCRVDVTDLKEEQAGLQSRLDAVKEMLDASPAVIYVKDPQGRYVMVNRGYTDLFHITSEDMIGRTDHDLFPRDVADTFRQVDLKVLTEGRAVTAEELAPNDDGTMHTYVSVKSPIKGPDGKPRAVFGISTDITVAEKARG